MAFKSSASPGSYSQVIDGSVAFSKTRKLQDANQTRAAQRQRHTKLLADRNRDNLNSLKDAQGVEGQSRDLALNDERNRRKIGANLELQRIQNAHQAAITNANNQANRAINSAKEIEGFINKTLDTGLDIYKQQRENRINQEKRDLAGIALKYGLSATDMAGLRGMTNEMIHDDGVQEGLGFKLRGYGMSTAEMLQVNGASKLAHAAVAINTGTLQYKNLASSVLLSQELVPGFNKTPAQLIEDGSPEAQAALRAEFNRMGAEIQVSLENLGIQNTEPFFKAYYGAKAEFESLLSKSSEAHANQKEDIAANQKIQWAHNNSEGGVLNFVSKEMGGAHAGGGGSAAIAVGKKYIGVIGRQIEQGILPTWLADELPNMKIPGTNFTLGTHGAYGEELLEVKKAARAHISGENSDRRQAAIAATNEYEKLLVEYRKLSKPDMEQIIVSEAKRLADIGDWNREAKIAKLVDIRNKTPEVTTPSQQKLERQRALNNGSWALISDFAIDEAHPNLKSRNDVYKKRADERRRITNSHVIPNAKRNAQTRVQMGSIAGLGHESQTWMEGDASDKWWARVEDLHNRNGLSPEDAYKEADRMMENEFKGDEFSGPYAVVKQPDPKGRQGFVGWHEAQGDVAQSQVSTYKERIDVFNNKTIEEADMSSLDIDHQQLKDQLNPNKPYSTHVESLVNDAVRITGYKGSHEEAIGEMITNLTGQTYTPPPITMSPAAAEVARQLAQRRIPENIGNLPVYGSGGSLGMPETFSHISSDSNERSALDATPSPNATHATAQISDGMVVDKGFDYNANAIGGDGRLGRGWGNWIKIRHTLPSGEQVDILYAHFPNEELDKWSRGAKIAQHQPIARYATNEEFDGRLNGVGSGSGKHLSMNAYNVGTWTPWSGDMNVIRNTMGGNQ